MKRIKTKQEFTIDRPGLNWRDQSALYGCVVRGSGCHDEIINPTYADKMACNNNGIIEERDITSAPHPYASGLWLVEVKDYDKVQAKAFAIGLQWSYTETEWNKDFNCKYLRINHGVMLQQSFKDKVPTLTQQEFMDGYDPSFNDKIVETKTETMKTEFKVGDELVYTHNKKQVFYTVGKTYKIVSEAKGGGFEIETDDWDTSLWEDVEKIKQCFSLKKDTPSKEEVNYMCIMKQQDREKYTTSKCGAEDAVMLSDQLYGGGKYINTLDGYSRHYTLIPSSEFMSMFPPPKPKPIKLFGYEVTQGTEGIKVGCQTYTKEELTAFLRIVYDIEDHVEGQLEVAIYKVVDVLKKLGI